MSRAVTISTEVFAAIWANRRDGEETEDAILRRVLGCAKASEGDAPSLPASDTGGVHDSRNGVTFPEGFEIQRIYKRKDYRAQARNGFWFRADNGARYPTLNQLNSSIAAGAENVWNGNWKYRAPDGTLRSIGELRP